MKFGMILLAAGRASRFGESKLEILLNNRPIIDYILSNIPAEKFDKTAIVAANLHMINSAREYGIKGVINSKPDEGLALSIKMGTEIVKDTDAYIYIVGDQPLLKRATIEGMMDAYEPNTILALAYDGKRGNPVIFPAYLHDELVSLKKGETGQKVINNHLDILKHYDIDDNTQLMDVDTKEDFEAIKNIINEKS